MVLAIINANILIILRLLEVLPENDHWSLLPMLMTASFIAAITTPVIFININSMFADIVDKLELATGERREGIIFAARAFAGKAAVALGTIIGGLALDFIAFPKNAAPGEVDPGIIFNLGFVQGPGTSICTLASLLRYSLTRDKHAEILSSLEERRNSKIGV